MSLVFFLLFHGIQLIWGMSKKNLYEKGEKMENTLPNHSSLFPSSCQLLVFPIFIKQIPRVRFDKNREIIENPTSLDEKLEK